MSFPGGPSFVLEAIDADVLARAFAWATTTSTSHNEIFNITNGDVFAWPNVWPAIADALGMEVGPPEPCSLATEMPKREAEWAAIVQKYGLRSPTSLRDFVGQSFIVTDFTFGFGSQNAVTTTHACQYHQSYAKLGFTNVWTRKIVFRSGFGDSRSYAGCRR